MDTRNKLKNIFGKLNLKKSYDIVMQLTTGGMTEYYSKLLQPIGSNNMIGGTKKVNVEYKGETFLFFSYNSDNLVCYALHPNNNINNRPECILIMVDKTNKSVEIHGLYYSDKCFSKVQIDTFGSEATGSLLFKVALLLINKIKVHYDLKFVHLRDNSLKYCNEIKKSINLDAFYMFVHGDTWYGKYGFVPYDPTKIKTSKIDTRDYKNNQKIVKTVLVKDTKICEHIKNAIKKLRLNISDAETNRLIKYNENKTIMEFMKMFMKEYDKSCGIFYCMYEDLMEEFGMTNLHGRNYWKQL